MRRTGEEGRREREEGEGRLAHDADGDVSPMPTPWNACASLKTGRCAGNSPTLEALSAERALRTGSSQTAGEHDR